MVSIETEGLTLLSELGIMVSVIQEPNLDPDARTVMGLLTPVSLPQPGGQIIEKGKMTYRFMYGINLALLTNKTHTHTHILFCAKELQLYSSFKNMVLY